MEGLEGLKLIKNNNLLKAKKILITGATGFLGSHLLPTLVEKGYNIIILKRSFSNIWQIQNVLSQIKSYDIDKVSIKEIFDENKIEGIIHIATDYGRKNNNDITQMFKANIELPTQLLDLGCKHRIVFFINTHTFLNSKYMLYSAMKNSFIEIAKYFSDNFKVKFINMKLEHVYGEKDEYSKFIPFIIKNILEKKTIEVTKGEQKRDFIYVQDVVNAYLKVLDNLRNLDEGFIEFAIGTGISTAIRDFVNKIEEQINKKANIKWGEIAYRKNEIFDSRAHIEKVKHYLGWSPKYDISSGLKRTVDWYKKSINR
ncbi:CDP-abequose synthase [subsurface metagenome]